MYPTIWFSILGAFLLLTIAYLIARQINERPELVCNRLGDVEAVVHVRDYKLFSRRIEGTNLRWVSPTFTFYERGVAVLARLALLGGSTDEFLVKCVGVRRGFNTNLFVPHVSEKYLSFAEQKQLFPRRTADELLTYIKKHRSLLKKLADHYLIFHYKREGWLTALRTVMFIMLIVGILWPIMIRGYYPNPANWLSFATIEQTDAGPIARQLDTSWNDDKPLPAYDGWFSKELFEVTIVSKPTYLGGGIASFRVKTSKGAVLGARASTSLNLKNGDEVIVRLGKVLNSVRNHTYDYERWVITREEAEALLNLNTGFRLVD